MSESTAELWKLFSERLRRYIAGRVRRQEDALDILHDVFARIEAALPRLRDRARLLPWLYRIARHAIVDYYRSPHRRCVSLPPELPERREDPALNRQVASWLGPLMDELSPLDREALQLDLEGAKDADVARRLGLTLTAAKSRVQRARRRLKDVLEDCCAMERDRRGNIVGYAPKRRACACEGR